MINQYPDILVTKVTFTMSVEELQKRICELEAALAASRAEGPEAGPVRDKITSMSSEVVDSTPTAG